MADGRRRKNSARPETDPRTATGKAGLPRLAMAAVFGFFLLALTAFGGEQNRTAEIPGKPESERLHTLSVTVLPDNASGSVMAVGAEINCPGNCVTAFHGGATITLVPKPAKGYVFDCWSMEMKSGKSLGAGSTQTDSKKKAEPKPMNGPNPAIESHDLENTLFVEIFSDLYISATFKPQNESDGEDKFTAEEPDSSRSPWRWDMPGRYFPRVKADGWQRVWGWLSESPVSMIRP